MTAAHMAPRIQTDLIDITSVPLRELLRVRNPDVAKAISKTLDDIALDQASAIQEQRE